MKNFATGDLTSPSLGERDPREALRAGVDRELVERVDPAAAPVARALGVERLDGPARRQRSREHLELACREDLGHVCELESEPRVGAIGAVALHRLGPGHAPKRNRQVVSGLVHDLAHDVFHQRHDVVGLDEAHLDVDLGELRLAVRTQVLVAEAARDLVVALDAAHHQQLLEELRRLGQRVELAGVHAARDDEVARAFRRGLGQYRRLDLHEPAMLERLAEALCDAVAQLQRREDLGAPDVEIAPLQARQLVGVDPRLDLERRRLGAVEHRRRGDDDLDLARGHVGVLGALGAPAHLSVEQHDPLGAHLLGGHERGTRRIRVEGALDDARAVPQVEEDQAAVVAALRDPSRETDRLADGLGGERACGVRAHRVACVEHQLSLPISGRLS